MAQNPENKKQKQEHAPAPIAQLPTRCPVDKCGQKPKRMHFCSEHFVWFKEGLVTKMGEKPKDFDQKYQAFLRRQQKAA